MRMLSPALPALATFTAIAACGLALAPSPTSAAAAMDSGDWHSHHKAGSIGIVDEADRDEFEFVGGRVRIRPGLDTASVVIRYDIQDGLNGHITPDYVAIIPRYRDNGPDARVIIRLKTYDVDTGDTSTLLTFDSNDFDQEQGYRLDNVNMANPPWQYLNGNAYWFEVTLQRTAAGGKPELGMIRYIWREA
jgi:hypothetical protein